MAYGLTTEGFVPKTLEIILEELRAAFRVAFGNSINVTTGLIAKMLAIFSEREALLWELAEAIYKSQDPDAALDEALDAICALTGTFRNPAKQSLVTLTLTGTPATVVASGSRAKVSSTLALYETTASGTITLLTSWVATTAYVVGDRRTNAAKTYVCITAGTSAGSGGPTTELASIVDGTVTWRYMGNGTGAVDATSRSVLTGPIAGVSGDIKVIETPVGGWSSVINLLDATLGADRESNGALRQRRDNELAAAGTSPIPAIRAALLKVTGVLAATVFYNNTDITDADGVPPHSVEALVRTTWAPGDSRDQLIFDCLQANVAGGIRTHGAVTGTVTDSEGTAHTHKFSRPTEKPIWIIINVDKDLATFPTNGSDQIKTAITAYGALQKSGKNAAVSPIEAQAHVVVGVNEVTSTLIGLSNPPTLSATIPISLRELATYDSSRITVNLTNGTP